MGCLFMKSKSEAILKVSALTKSVQLDEKTLELLQPVHLTVNSGETLAIVGAPVLRLIISLTRVSRAGLRKYVKVRA